MIVMLRFCIIWGIILMSCVLTSAQIPEGVSIAGVCPSVFIRADSTKIQANKNVLAVADITFYSNTQFVEYKWTVTGGEIINGQGTPFIKIKPDLNSLDKKITATIELLKLKDYCTNNKASIFIEVDSQFIDESFYQDKTLEEKSLFFAHGSEPATNGLICPDVSVLIEPEVVRINDIINAGAVITSSKTDDLKFIWTVSGGNIVEGQNTPVIKFKPDEKSYGKTLTATLEVKGFDPSCENKASDFVVIELLEFLPRPIDEYGKVDFEREKAGFDWLITELSELGGGTALIEFCATKKSTQKYIDARLKRLFTYLTDVRGFKPNEILFAIDKCYEEITTLWAVSKRANLPIPLKPQMIKGETLSEKYSPGKTKKKK